MSEIELEKLKIENSILKSMVKRIKQEFDIIDLLDNIVHCNELTAKLGWKTGDKNEVDAVLDQGDIQRICDSASKEIKRLRENEELYYNITRVILFLIIGLIFLCIYLSGH